LYVRRHVGARGRAGRCFRGPIRGAEEEAAPGCCRQEPEEEAHGLCLADWRSG
jgi:hypothetical protein